jgi:dTDP-4-dehydrorhamnose 3,5-epimerase
VIFEETTVSGVFLVRVDPRRDDRGIFARTWCREEFEDRGLVAKLAQCSTSFNSSRGTLRGLHYQSEPFAEAKLVRCTAGAIYDVALDLRSDSPTFCQWYGTILNERNRNSLYIPCGCAHGFLTIEDDSEVFYQISEFYHPEASQGVRWNDPAFHIEWPAEVQVISDRDRTYTDFQCQPH